MRDLRLTHEEIELIENAFRNQHNDTLKFIQDNRYRLTDGAIEQLLDRTNKGDTLRSQIANSEKDIYETPKN